MNNRDVAHRWANQTQKFGRGSNFYFHGPDLYSYGPHFEVGRIVTREDGTNCVLFNSARYSVSTSKHQSYARSAASHLTCYTVPNVGAESMAQHGEKVAYMLKEIDEAHAAALRARSGAEWALSELGHVIDEADSYAESFRVPAPLRRKVKDWARKAAAGTLVSPEEKTKLLARAAADKKRRAAEIEKRRKAQEVARAKAAEDLLAWVGGADTRPTSWHENLPTRLRIKGAAVETSRGAVVSLRAARVLWAAIKAGRDIVGAEVDGFRVSEFNGELVIGCHRIAREEVARLGAISDGMGE